VANLFDDEGVTGVHGIERILWSDSQPERVIKFERSLEHYQPAAFPQTREQAGDFKNKLAAKLVTDAKAMRDQLAPIALETGTAFWGMIGSMQEQSEKTTLGASGEDESRYAQNTLADMRANLAGARAVYEAFKPWIESASSLSQPIEQGFSKLQKAYDEIEGPALPPVPEGFNPDKPSDADLASDYGKLWKLLQEETDPDSAESLVSIMGEAANAMQIDGITADEE